MKTQVLQLEAHDDVISTRDKMGWGQTGRILLVWPGHGRVLTRQLDLALLSRHSQSLGAQLALVTADPEVRFNASLLGISTFASLRQAQGSRWKRPRRRKASRFRPPDEARQLLAGGRPRTAPAELAPLARLGFFSLGVLAVLSIAAALFPSAELQLTPATELQEISLDVQASRSIERVNLAGAVPIQVANAIVEGRDQIEPTVTAQVPERAATGEALFTNLTDQPVSIPAGMIVSTLGAPVRFATSQDGRIPTGPGRTLRLPITAVRPGRAGNLAAGRIQAIEGPLGVDLTVTSPEPTSGGSDRPGLAPTSLDRDRLRERLLSRLRESALAEIRAGLGPDDLLLVRAPTLARTLEESFDPPGGEPASLLSLTLRLEFQAQLISGEDLRNLAGSVLDANLPQGYSPLPETLGIEFAKEPQLAPGESSARLALLARRRIQARLSEEGVANLALGLSPGGARHRLGRELPLARPPQIRLHPAWWPRLPILPFRISVSSNQ